MSKNDKPKEKPEKEIPKTPPEKPEFPKSLQITEGKEEKGTSNKDKDE